MNNCFDKPTARQIFCERTLIVLGILLVIFLWPKGMGYDGRFRFLSLDFLFRFGILDDFKFSLMGPLFASPLYLMGFVFKHPHWWVSKFNSTLFLFSLYGFYRILKGKIDANVLRRFLLLLLCASLFPKQIKEFYGEPFTQILAALGLTAMIYNRDKLGIFSLLVATVNTAGTVVASSLALGLRVWQAKRLRYLIVLPLALTLIFLENYLRRGHPLLSGYEGEAPPEGIYTILPYTSGPGFSYPFAFGLLSILFSFGKGLLYFTPGLFLPWKKLRPLVSKEVRQLRFLWLAYLAGLILVYGRWFNWYGGGYWGPRFFLIACYPACLALALYISRKQSDFLQAGLTIIVLALSVWVGWCGLVIDESLSGGAANDLEALTWYVPEFSVLWRPFVITPHLSINDWVFATYFGLVFICLVTPVLRSLMGVGTQAE